MKLLYKPFSNRQFEGDWVVMVGNFDGFHLGHQALAHQLTLDQKEFAASSAILTFDPHPKQVLQPEVPFYQIYPNETKWELIEQTGIDACLIAPFSHQFAGLSATEFMDRLFRYIRLKKVLVGYDFNFGKGREGSAQMFELQCQKNGVQFEMVAPVRHKGFTVSSTLIRRLLFEAEFKEAAHFLGRRWSIAGEVTQGMRKGHELGFPTLNLPSEVLLPIKLGVYVCEVLFKGTLYPAVCNVGYKPTFEGKHLVAEAHLFGFSEEGYGEHAEIFPVHFLREEKKFTSLELLSSQIQQDAAQARAYFGIPMS